MARMTVWVALAMTLAVTGCKMDNSATRACRGESTRPMIPALAIWGDKSECDACCKAHDSLADDTASIDRNGCVCH